jgi:GAF domain-containing protein
MPAAPLPSFEKERLSALAELNIADSDFDAGFDIFPLLASKVLETSFAAVTLVDFDVLRFKAGVGIREPSMPRAHSICPYAILNPSEVLTIPDAATDPRVLDYPAVIAKEIGSYAGVPISGPSGLPLGALCVVDKVARQYSAESLVQLGYLAVGTEGAIKLHAAAEERRRSSMTDPLTGVGNRLSFEKRSG